MIRTRLSDRLERERAHGKVILEGQESNWGWRTPAGQLRRQRRATYLTELGPTSEKPVKVLELGCGTGTFTGDFSRSFPDLTAIDISDSLLEVAAQRFPNVKFVNADIHATPFEAMTFDLVVGCSVLHHLEWDDALKEVFRILRPGGALRFTEPNLQNPQIFLQKKWPWLKKRMGDSLDETAFTPRRIRDSLQRAGFVSIFAEPFEFLHPAVPEAWVPAVVRLESWVEKTPLRQIAGSIKISALRPR
jgi:ubiquinone/menaquinone biosynthesis C-methylase UbiE